MFLICATNSHLHSLTSILWMLNTWADFDWKFSVKLNNERAKITNKKPNPNTMNTMEDVNETTHLKADEMWVVFTNDSTNGIHSLSYFKIFPKPDIICQDTYTMIITLNCTKLTPSRVHRMVSWWRVIPCNDWNQSTCQYTFSKLDHMPSFHWIKHKK